MKKAARFSIEILSLLLLMSHFLAGCSEEYGYNSEIAATESATPAPTIIDEDAAETVPSSGEELHMLTAQQGIAMTVGGETANGCYSLDTYPDASADIIYYDYLTQECIRLSADANLGHDPASTAYIPSFKGGARCFVVGDYLYVIKTDSLIQMPRYRVMTHGQNLQHGIGWFRQKNSGIRVECGFQLVWRRCRQWNGCPFHNCVHCRPAKSGGEVRFSKIRKKSFGI